MSESNSSSGRGRAHGDNKATFEENFARLQDVVARLSEGNLTLQEALLAYEEGMALAEHCGNMLDGAELRVKQVSDRALKAGSASLHELVDDMRGTNGHAEGGLVAIEIERYDAALIFEDAPIPQQASPRKEPPNDEGQQGPRPLARPPQHDLDPLFDDDD